MVSRKRLLAGSAAAFASVGILRFPASAAQFTYKIGFDVPESHPVTVRLRGVAEKVKTETNGRLELKLFANNQLGGDTAMLQQVRTGATEMVMIPDNVLSNVVPLAAISNIGFAFNDAAQAFATMDGPLGSLIRENISNAGLFAFAKEWNNGFRQITTAPKPITSVEDLRNFKIRVPESPIGLSMFKGLGAAPVAINFSELYTALETHIADGQENALTLVETARLFEVQKFCSVTNHMWAGYWAVVNGEAWSRLPKDVQEVLERSMDEATTQERNDIEKLNASLQPKLISQGLKFNTVQTDGFRRKLHDSGFYTNWKNQYGAKAWSLLERSVGKLA